MQHKLDFSRCLAVFVRLDPQLCRFSRIFEVTADPEGSWIGAAMPSTALQSNGTGGVCFYGRWIEWKEGLNGRSTGARTVGRVCAGTDAGCHEDAHLAVRLRGRGERCSRARFRPISVGLIGLRCGDESMRVCVCGLATKGRFQISEASVPFLIQKAGRSGRISCALCLDLCFTCFYSEFSLFFLTLQYVMTVVQFPFTKNTIRPSTSTRPSCGRIAHGTPSHPSTPSRRG